MADLNADPVLPLDHAAFDAALCCVEIQYLLRPFDGFREVGRVLAPGAPFLVSYANRCFPTKAVAIWRSLDVRNQASSIGLYMERAGFTGIEARALSDGSRGDPLVVVIGYASASADLDLGLRAIPLARETRHLVELAQALEPATLLAIAHNLKPMSLELRDGIEVGGGSLVQVDHDGDIATAARNYDAAVLVGTSKV